MRCHCSATIQIAVGLFTRMKRKLSFKLDAPSKNESGSSEADFWLVRVSFSHLMF